MDKALSVLGLNSGEKAVEGTFDCIKRLISGRNELALEKEKTKQYAIGGTVLLGAIAIISYAYDEFGFSAGDKQFHAARR